MVQGHVLSPLRNIHGCFTEQGSDNLPNIYCPVSINIFVTYIKKATSKNCYSGSQVAFIWWPDHIMGDNYCLKYYILNDGKSSPYSWNWLLTNSSLFWIGLFRRFPRMMILTQSRNLTKCCSVLIYQKHQWNICFFHSIPWDWRWTNICTLISRGYLGDEMLCHTSTEHQSLKRGACDEIMIWIRMWIKHFSTDSLKKRVQANSCSWKVVYIHVIIVRMVLFKISSLLMILWSSSCALHVPVFM